MLLLLAFHSFIFLSHATERFLTVDEATRLGFKPQLATITKSLNQLPRNLKWPFEAPYRNGFIGNNFNQYQPYSPPGYHLGSDMILETKSWVVAPFAGKLEAGEYTYTDLPNGSRIKYWKPWPQGSGSSYEIAIIDDSGNRFEFHHVDKDSFPKEINEILKKKGSVQTGDRLAQVIEWSTPFHYDHVHVNVTTSAGVELNPEDIFEKISDTIAPDAEVFFYYKDGSTSPLTELKKDLKGFIVHGRDRKDNNQFSQAIPFISLQFENGEETRLDFRSHLRSGDGVFYDIRNLYPSQITLPNGKRSYQPRDYYPNNVSFNMYVPLPRKIGTGRFVLTVKDNSDNERQFPGNISGN